MQTKDRIAKWDNAKLLLIFLVVIGHLFMRFDDNNIEARRILFFIYIFHMPAFIFISGLFSKGIVDTRRFSAVGSMLILFLVTKFSYFISKIFAESSVSFRLRKVDDIAWYALAIAAFYLITMLIKDYSKLYMLIFSIVVALFMGYAKDIGTYLTLSRMFTFYPFFLMGYYVDREKLEKFISRPQIRISAIIVTMVVAVLVYFTVDDLYWMMDILRGKRSYTRMNFEGDFEFVFRILWYILASVMTLSMLAIVPARKNFLSKFGSRTLSVYALHYILMQIFFFTMSGKEWLDSMIEENGVALPFVILTLVGIVITGLLASKPVDWLMSKAIYPKKQEKRETRC